MLDNMQDYRKLTLDAMSLLYSRDDLLKDWGQGVYSSPVSTAALFAQYQVGVMKIGGSATCGLH